MISLLDQLHDYAYELRSLGLLQIAGDIDYLVAWLKSPEYNNGYHLRPNPAGKDTIDFYSNNCQIPHEVCPCIVMYCKNDSEAITILKIERYLISELLSTYVTDEEQIAILAYIKYLDEIITIMGGGDTPEPPEPEEHFFNIFVPEYIIGTSGQVYATYDNKKVTPVWSIAPPNGATISNSGAIDFFEDGEYIVTARYSGMSANANVTLEYKSGWSTKTEIDDSGDHPIVNTIITDDQENTTIQTVEVINGEEVHTGYEIQPGGESVTIVDGVDTKVKTFDGHNGFSLLFKFKVDLDTAEPDDWVPKDGNYNEKLYTVLNISSEISPYPGLSLRLGAPERRVQVRIKSTNQETGEVTPLPTKYITYNDDHKYWLQIQYDPSKSFEKFILKDLRNNTIVNTYSESSLVFNNDVTATIGYTAAPVDESDPSQGTYKCRQCNLEVIEFKISKIIYEESEIPTISIDNADEDKPYLMTQQITVDENPEIRSLTIVPKDPEQEYVFINEPILTNVKPFSDPDKGFEIELDTIIDYNDQPNLSASGQKWTILYMMQETIGDDEWHGFLIRLESDRKPGTSGGGTTGRIKNILRYENSSGGITQKDDYYNILESKIYHVKFVYDPKASERTISCYSYVSGNYINYGGLQNRVIVPTHNFNMVLGGALTSNWPSDQTIQRIGYFWLKKFSYKVID